MSIPDAAPPPAEPSTVEAWVRRHQISTWRFLRYLGCAPDLADDLLQTALLAAVEAGVVARDDAAAAAWLRSTARNLFISHLRALGRRPQADELTDAVGAEAAFMAFHDRGAREPDVIDALRECFERLAPRARVGLERFYRDGARRQEVAAELGLDVEGFKTMLRRAKDGLRTCVENKREEQR